jgi:CDP-paratose 2-epimerase
MSVVIVTGSAGLIRSEATIYFGQLGFDIVGIDNDMRQVFFGQEASTAWNAERIIGTIGRRYRHYPVDIRNRKELRKIFSYFGRDIALVIHTAAQPSHHIWWIGDNGKFQSHYPD